MSHIKLPGDRFWLLYICVFFSFTVVLAFLSGYLSHDKAKAAVEMLINITKLLAFASSI
jgi:hypothetical protein